MREHNREQCDFLVIGSGIAGLCFAIHAARHGSVVVVTKKSDSDSNTNRAQGGIACVLDPLDSFRSHIEDTLATGKGLSDPEAVGILVESGPERIRELLRWGVRFSTDPASHAAHKLDLGKEGGHSVNRIVHAHDLTGREVEHALLQHLRGLSNARLLENHCAVELITGHHVTGRLKPDRCLGAYVLDAVERSILTVQAKITCLATGGAGQVYLHTTNPEIANGDGFAMAYRAGALIANMEFIQFHPTSLYHESADSFLISEAVRGFGAVLRDSEGKEFMNEYHPMGSLAPRDIVAQAIDREMKRTGRPCVYLDIRHRPPAAVRKRFPNIFARCRQLGIDITSQLIPVVPAAHYVCGGVRVDTFGNSTLPCLYACGEVACTGVHGANRLASNSLLEAVVFSHRAVANASASLGSTSFLPGRRIRPWDDRGTIDTEEWVLLSHNMHELKSAMWDYVGIVRSTVRLHRARRRVQMLQKEVEEYYRRTRITPALLELRNAITTARLIVVSALRRHESRGLHFTTDFPDRNERYWKRETLLRKSVGT